MRFVRTTLTIDDDLAALLQAEARATGRTFRAVVNQALRDGLLREADQARYEPPVHDLGIRPGVDLTKALQLVGRMEDEEVIRKMEVGK